MEIIKVIINSLIITLSFLKIGEILLESKPKISKLKVLVVALINAIFLSLNHIIVKLFLKFVFCMLSFVFLVKYIYKKELDKSIIFSILCYLTIIVSETIIILLINAVYSLFSLGSIEMIKNTIFVTVLISLLTITITYKAKKQYKAIINKIDSNNPIMLAILTITILICLGSMINKIEIIGWTLSFEYLLNTIIIITTVIIGVLVIRQRVNYEKIENQYKNLAKYSKTSASLLEEYSVLNHEYKNQLIIIDGMIKETDTELKSYVNTLLNKNKNIKFRWIRDLNNITFLGLKSFLNYKIMEICEESIKINVSVSSECKKIKLEELSNDDKDKLYSIIGVFLDNARDASRQSSEKQIIINIFMEKNQMILEFANTYSEKIDINKVNNYGYTTKGTGHGTGLYMVQKIIKFSEIFDIDTIINEKYFIQKLKIKSTKK